MAIGRPRGTKWHFIVKKLGRDMGEYACGRWGDRADYLTADPHGSLAQRMRGSLCKGCARQLDKIGEAFARQLAGVAP